MYSVLRPAPPMFGDGCKGFALCELNQTLFVGEGAVAPKNGTPLLGSVRTLKLTQKRPCIYQQSPTDHLTPRGYARRHECAA